MFCVSVDDSLCICSSMTVAEAYQQYATLEMGCKSKVSVLGDNNGPVYLKYDLGGVVFVGDKPLEIKLGENIYFEFLAQHWTSLKFELKQAARQGDSFVRLDGRWLKVVLTKDEAAIVLAQLEKNNDKYVAAETEVLDKHSQLIESLRQTKYYAETTEIKQ